LPTALNNATTPAAAADTAQAAFATPATATRPMLRWWWPGGAVDALALCAQLRGFAAAGWGGVEIQPCRIGLPHGLPADQAAQVHDTFTPAWFQTVATVMAEAQRLGLVVDTTFGSAWPFGGAHITPELATQELTLDWATLQGPMHWQGRPPLPARPLRNASWQQQQGGLDAAQALPAGWPDRIAAQAEVVAVLALRGGEPSLGPYPGFVPMTLPDRWGQVLAAGWVHSAQTIDLTDRLQPDGTLSWDVPEGQWQLITVRRFVSDQMVLEGAGAGPQLVADHLNRAAFDAHAAAVGEAALAHWAAFAGAPWRSIFIDSLEIPADLLWTADFAEQFARRRGYALRPHLPLLLQPGWRNCFQARLGAPLFDDADAGPRLRHDYRLTVSELMIERLYAPMQSWAAQHGLQAKVQAHGAPVDWLQAYGVAGIPETEDLAGGAAPHFLRVARSAAHLYGRPLVTGEAFCWLLDGLAVTPQQVRERADAFYAAGIQQLVGHGAAARMAGWPAGQHPWFPFEAMEIGTVLDDANPWFELARPLTDYMARNQTLLQRGRARVPVAVLAPLDLFAFTSAAERLTPPPWHEALQDAGYDWDWLNDHALLTGTLVDGALVSPGGQRYQAVLLPELPALRAEVAERLAACAAAGVAVWAVGSVPQREAGWLDAAARDARVRSALQQALHGGRQLVAPSAVGRALRTAGVPPSVALPAGHGCAFHVRDDGARQWLLLRNPGDDARTLAWPLPTGQAAQAWDCWTGGVQPLAPDAAGQLLLALPARSARWLRLAPVDAGAVVQAVVPAGSQPTSHSGSPAALLPASTQIERALTGPWQLRARGRGLGGRSIQLDAGWPTLIDPRTLPELADFAGQLHYTLRFDLSADELAHGPLWLHPGTVHDALALRVNGGAPQYRAGGPLALELSGALQVGANVLEITVANAPENARRDPARPGGLPLPGRRLTRLPTGLLGPVWLRNRPD